MKTTEELEKGFEQDLVNLKCNQHGEYNTPYTGDIIVDFATFTLLQSGDPRNNYKSCNPTDSASKNPPPECFTDGVFYHTVKDVTWTTYHSVFPNNTSMQFYNMTNEERGACIMPYINAGKLTSSNVINMLITYILWGGSLSTILLTYHNWYNTILAEDAVKDERGTFDKLIDVRRYVYSNCLGSASKINGLGWDRGILNFWKLFSQYL